MAKGRKKKKKKKEEKDLKEDELNPGQVMIGDKKLGETYSSIIEHTPALWGVFMAYGLNQAYNDELKKHKTTKQAVQKAIMTHLKVIEGSLPQLKLIHGLQQDVPNSVMKNAENLGWIKPNKKESTKE